MTDQPYAMSFLPYLRLGLGADAKAGLTYLFDALPNTVAKLAIGAPTAELRGQFQNSGIRLTQQARVEKQPAGNDWKVIDSDAVYLIRSESPAVRVYAVDNLHRSKVVHTLVKNQAGTTLWTDSHAAVLRGPGDIIGFHDHLIARTEPVSGATDFEPNYFPFIEFKDPDFSWCFPAAALRRPGAR
jgi:hypothetical protein